MTIYLRVYGLIPSSLRHETVITLTNGIHLMPKYYSIAMNICFIFTTIGVLIWCLAAYLLKDEALMQLAAAPVSVSAILTVALYKLISTHSQ